MSQVLGVLEDPRLQPPRSCPRAGCSPTLPAPDAPPQIMMDFHACTWHSVPGLSNADDSIAAHMDSLNEPEFSVALEAIDRQEAATGSRPVVISCSHFLPHQASVVVTTGLLRRRLCCPAACMHRGRGPCHFSGGLCIRAISVGGLCMRAISVGGLCIRASGPPTLPSLPHAA